MMRSRLPRRLGALVATIAVLCWPVASAAADPPAGGALVASPTLSLTDLGSSSTISFNLQQDATTASLAFPVPRGLAPVALNATLELPTNLRSANLAVSQDDRTISRMALPLADQAPLVIPLTGTQVFGDYATVTLTLTALGPDNFCWDYRTPIRLVNGSITFAGSEAAPTTVAGFLPPVLRKLTVAVPATPSQAESDAAVQLAAAMAMRYGGQNPEIQVVALPAGATALPNPSAPLERQIVVKEGPDKGLSLQGAGASALLISGPGKELTNQARLLNSDSLQYALSPKTVAATLPTDQKFATDSTSLQQLNSSGLSSEALWPQVSIELDQSRFGHPLHGVRVHLIGSYTPLPNSLGGEVTASVGNDTVDRWPTDGNGTIDRWVNIPDRSLKRSTTLDVKVHTTGDAGMCGNYLPLSLVIDGNSAIEVSDAKPPVPPGFQSLPQALMPQVQFGIGGDAFGDTARAAEIAVGLQQMSGVALMTTVTSLKQAIDSKDPAVLISSDGWNDKTIALPFSADKGAITVQGVDSKGDSTTLTLDPAIRYGSLQTAFDGQRSVLVASSNGAPAQLDELLRWLSSERGRWSGLDGRAVISVPGAAPVTVPNPPADLSAPEAPKSSRGQDWEWWIVGGVAAVAAIGALLIVLRTRRA